MVIKIRWEPLSPLNSNTLAQPADRTTWVLFSLKPKCKENQNYFNKTALEVRCFFDKQSRYGQIVFFFSTGQKNFKMRGRYVWLVDEPV